jgi:hypothetical protein
MLLKKVTQLFTESVNIGEKINQNRRKQIVVVRDKT